MSLPWSPHATAQKDLWTEVTPEEAAQQAVEEAEANAKRAKLDRLFAAKKVPSIFLHLLVTRRQGC